MGNRYVKVAGAAVAIIGVLMLVIGVALMNFEETERTWLGIYVTTKPYEDVGNQVYVTGALFTVLGVVISITGVFAKPSKREVIRAQCKEEKERSRLSMDDYSDDYITDYEPILAKSESPRPKASTRFCRYCGAAIPEDSAFCEECGRRLKE